MKSIITEVNEKGEVQLPDEFVKELGWTEKTFLNFDFVDGSVKVSEKVEWTMEEAQEHIEGIVDRVVESGVPHKIITEDGKAFMVVPYTEEMEKILG